MSNGKEEKGSSGPEISMGVAEEKPKASEDIGEMKYEEYLCKLETAAKGGMLEGEYNKEKQNLDYIGKHIAKTEEIRLKTQASRQALERAYLEIKAKYGETANRSQGKSAAGHGKDSSLTKICPKCGREYGEEYKYPRCSKDGSELFKLWECRHCGEVFSKVQGYTAINVCPNCGEKLDPKQKEAINKGRSSETNILKRICTKCQEIFDGEFECCGMCGNSTIPMQCACGEIFRQREDGSFDKYCPVCGKPNPVEQEKQRKAAEEALKKKKEEQERIKQQEEERKKAEARRIAEEKERQHRLLIIELQSQFRRIAEEKERQHRERINNLKAGDIIEFGSYPYEADGTKKPVEWRILEKKADGTALVISKYGLDARRFDESSNNWERSEIRQWLNNEFYNAAFKDEEKNIILEYREAGSKVFLLSVKEAGKYFKNNEDRKAWPTPYAKGRGASTNDYVGGSGWWWLRSPGRFQLGAALVDVDGSVYSHGYGVDFVNGVVRVALKINLNNL